ncbi:magnesium transporter MgtC [bacterium]|nr:magnesium transporter MgtC [bacterium]|tara:strand:- start:20630 stop:21145 length:516 start_codon:yes stop_codon:yes gene_type:complete
MFFEFDPTLATTFLQLSLAAFLGLLLGAERSIAGKSAGMRTFALVSLGACLFVVVSVLITTQYFGKVNFDPMRVPAAIISGIGFIGAGLIMFRQNLMRGLTTAAGMWVAAGVGAAVGFGLYYIATFTTLLTLLIFTAVWFIEANLKLYFGRHNVEPVVNKDHTSSSQLDDE